MRRGFSSPSLFILVGALAHQGALTLLPLTLLACTGFAKNEKGFERHEVDRGAPSQPPFFPSVFIVSIDDEQRRKNMSSKKIAELNDSFRKNPFGNGRTYVTAGVNGNGPEFVAKAFRLVQAYDDFTPDNDPYQERNFGNFKLGDEKIYFKIDYYDKDCDYGSEDPSDPNQTTRVLTIMLAEEY